MATALDNSSERVQEIVERINDGKGDEVVAEWDSIVATLSEEQADKVRRTLIWNNVFTLKEISEGSEQIEKILPLA